MLMSKSAYARHRGVSRQTVYDWIAKGEIVMSGSKIDVQATQQRQGGAGTRPTYSEDDLDREARISPRASASHDESEEDALYEPFTATADEAAMMVLMLDDLYPPAESYDELQHRIHDASEALGLELRLIEIEGDDEYIRGLEFFDPEQGCIACRFDSPMFEMETLTFFRWLVTTKKVGTIENATKAGLAALAEPFVHDLRDIYNDRAGLSNESEE